MIRRNFLFGATAASLAPPPAAQAATSAARLDTFIQNHVREHRFNGSILIQQVRRLRYAQSFGFANLEFGIAHRIDTRFWIASITKAMTAVLILKLVEQRRIGLDVTIGSILPDYAGEARDRVTIHQLLNHTSGLENIDRIPNIEDVQENMAALLEAARARDALPIYQTPYTSEQLLRIFCSGPLAREPGTAFDYNNADYIILGKIIERSYGATYERVLSDQILGPLGMTATGLLRQQDIVANLSSCYSPATAGAALVRDTPVYPENWYAAGGLYSTVRDILSFANALFSGSLIGRRAFDRMITPGLDNYGYGVWSYDMRIDGTLHRVVKRPGQIMGARAQLFHMIASDITIVMLANTGTTDLDAFVAGIARKLVGKSTP